MQLRARKTKESKIEAYKRRLRERHEMRKCVWENGVGSLGTEVRRVRGGWEGVQKYVQGRGEAGL